MLVPSDRSDPVLRLIGPHGMRWGTARSSPCVRSPIPVRSRAAVINCSPAMPWTGRSTPVEVARHRRMATFDGYCGASGDSAQLAARLLRRAPPFTASDAACSPKVLLVNAVGGVSGRGRVTRGIACQLRHRRSISAPSLGRRRRAIKARRRSWRRRSCSTAGRSAAARRRTRDRGDFRTGCRELRYVS